MYDRNNNEIGSRFFNKIYVRVEKGKGIALPEVLLYLKSEAE